VKIDIQLDLEDVVGETGPYDEDGHGQPLTLLSAIVNAAGARLFNDIDRQVKGDLHRRTASLLDEEIRARISPLIDEALGAGVEPVLGGQRVPLRQHIVDIVRGEVKWQDRGRSSYDRSPLARFVHEQIEYVLTKELKAEIEQAKRQVRDAIRAQGAEFLARTVEQMAAK
jgi:hypothetical protein